MKRPDPRYWSPYWRLPTITSFGTLFPDNYDGVMLEFWKRQISPDMRHIVDVACGNGALTWIANELTEGPEASTRITGMDLADIDPFSALNRHPAETPRISFIGSTPAEQLPLADGSVDLVISQYGIEYSDLDRSIPEIARVLTDNGRMAFILHDKESVILEGATRNLADLQQIHREIRLHEICAEFDQLLRTDRNLKRLSATAAYKALESRLLEAQYRLRALLRGNPSNSQGARYEKLLHQAMELKAAKSADQRTKLIKEAETGIRLHIERVEDLSIAARSAEDREKLVALVERDGFRVMEMDVMRYKDGDNFGTTFVAQRP